MNHSSTALFSKAFSFSLGLALVTSCADDHSRRIDVREPNELGVTSLQIDRLEDHGNAVFVLTAFSARQEELASVRLTTGEIAELTPLRDGSSLGAELDIAVGPASSHSVTRSVERIDVALGGREPAVVDFLQLATVTHTLAREANIFVVDPPSPESGYPFNPPTKNAQSCPPRDMNVTPIAKQCCLSTDSTTNSGFTYHVGVKGTGNLPPTFIQDQTIVYRALGPYGACRQANGDPHCSGATCYYGPNGYAVPVQTTPPSGTEYGRIRVLAVTGGKACSPSWNDGPVTSPDWNDVVGAFATGQGCCSGTATTPTQGCCANTIFNTATDHCCSGAITPLSTSCGLGNDTSGAGIWD